MFSIIAIAHEAWMLHGWRPDIVVEGQIVDQNTKEPIEQAWVPILIMISGRAFDDEGRLRWYTPEGAATGRLSPMSTVVQTDNEGRFSYRVSVHEAVQSLGYTRFEVDLGAYKKKYQSVKASDGKPTESVTVHLPYSFRRNAYHDWPALKRRLSSSDLRLLIGGNVDRVSDKTWPAWARYAHVLASDEIDTWCNAPNEKENLSFGAFYEASNLVALQGVLLAKSLARDPVASRENGAMAATDLFESLSKTYHDATPEFAWSEALRYHPANEATTELGRRPFQSDQKAILCNVLRVNSERLLRQSISLRSSQK